MKKQIKGIIALLSLVTFTGCGAVEVKEASVTDVQPEIDTKVIVENSVTWMREQAQIELKKNLVAADYLDSYKGSVAQRENIPSEQIYKSIKKHCRTYNIGPAVIVGLSIRESNVTQKPRDSSANCRGMCQISKAALSDFNTWVMWPKYHDAKKFYTWEDMYDYDKNIEVACWYLRHLWESYSDVKTLEDVLICYNVGHGNLAKYKAKAGYEYHTFIIARAKEYQSLINKFPA